MSDFKPALFVNREELLDRFAALRTRRAPHVLLLIEAPEKLGKTWMLGQFELECRQVTLPAAGIDLRDPRLAGGLDALRLLRLLRDALAGLLPGGSAHVATLNTIINRYTGDTQVALLRPMLQLADRIVEYFSTHNDLRRLATLLNYIYDDLQGGGVSDKAFDLVNRCRQQMRLSELVQLIADEGRGGVGVNWSVLATAITATAAPVNGAGPAATVDNDAPLRAFGPERDEILRTLTTAFVAMLRDALASVERAVLLIDSYEVITRDAAYWFEELFLPQLADAVLKQKLIVVVAGRDVPYVALEPIQKLILLDPANTSNPQSHPLPPFTLEHCKALLGRHNITELPAWVTWEGIFMLTQGKPGMLALQIDLIKQAAGA